MKLFRTDKLHRLIERDSRLAHNFFYIISGFGAMLDNLPTFSTKSDVIFLVGDPDFLER